MLLIRICSVRLNSARLSGKIYIGNGRLDRGSNFNCIVYRSEHSSAIVDAERILLISMILIIKTQEYV